MFLFVLKCGWKKSTNGINNYLIHLFIFIFLLLLFYYFYFYKYNIFRLHTNHSPFFFSPSSSWCSFLPAAQQTWWRNCGTLHCVIYFTLLLLFILKMANEYFIIHLCSIGIMRAGGYLNASLCVCIRYISRDYKVNVLSSLSIRRVI